jgi:hypothetical protein
MGMSKEELIEAVNGTLISNEEKAITADALRNLLTDIVENSGNGGGITFQVGFEINENGSETCTVTPEQIAHNKEQIDILKQLHDEGKPIPPIALEVISTMEGMEVSEIMMYIINILWDTTGTEVPEGMPEGLIFPVVSILEVAINGDGTLIIL